MTADAGANYYFGEPRCGVAERDRIARMLRSSRLRILFNLPGAGLRGPNAPVTRPERAPGMAVEINGALAR